MSRRIFEAGESGPARELSKEEKLKMRIRARLAESAKKGWVQNLLKTTNTSLEQWLDEQVTNEMEKEKKMRENIEQDKTD
jgi:hypothetical protein